MPIAVVDEPYDGPVAAALIEEVQQEYVVRYGGHDEAPVEAAEFGPERDGAFLVAVADGEPVGCVGLRRHDDDDGRDQTDVRPSRPPAWRARSRPAAGGRGPRQRPLGYARVLLETGTRQPEAIALYAADGYQPLAGFGHYAGPSGQPGLRQGPVTGPRPMIGESLSIGDRWIFADHEGRRSSPRSAPRLVWHCP